MVAKYVLLALGGEFYGGFEIGANKIFHCDLFGHSSTQMVRLNLYGDISLWVDFAGVLGRILAIDRASADRKSILRGIRLLLGGIC